MPLNLRLDGIMRDSPVYFEGSWGSNNTNRTIVFNRQSHKECRKYYIHTDRSGVGGVIKDKLSILRRTVKGKTMNLYFTDFWFDQLGTLNVESIAAQRLRPLMRRCKKCSLKITFLFYI